MLFSSVIYIPDSMFFLTHFIFNSSGGLVLCEFLDWVAATSDSCDPHRMGVVYYVGHSFCYTIRCAQGRIR